MEETIFQIIDNIFEAVHLDQLSYEDYRPFSKLIQEMCMSNSPAQLPGKLYEHYKEICEGYVFSEVLPSLRGKKGEILLKELVQQWSNYKVVREKLSRIFFPLDKYFYGQDTYLTLLRRSNLVFYQEVYGEMNDQVRDAAIFEINQDRNGKKIDKEVVRNALAIYVEIAEHSMTYYEKDFEEAMLEDTAQFYAREASELYIKDDDYRIAVVEKIKNDEEDRALCCLHVMTYPKIMEAVHEGLRRAHGA